MPASYSGAIVGALVSKHRKAYAEQTNPSRPQEPVCTGPTCGSSAPSPYQAPLVRTKIKTKVDATCGIAQTLRDREAVAFVRDPDEAIYSFEVAPPPTPPPNGFLNWAII